MATIPRTADASTSQLPTSIWRAPLVPFALAVTLGIVVDRYAPIPLLVSLLAGAVFLLAWLIAQIGARSGLPIAYLALAAAAFGAAYHHFQRDFYPADDVGNFAPSEPRPVALRGTIDEEPRRTVPRNDNSPLRSRPQGETASTVVLVSAVQHDGAWAPVSGRVRLQASGPLPPLHIGDEVEVMGRLALIAGPANPGEFDFRAYCRDRGIRAQISVRHAPAGVARLERRWPTSWRGWLAVGRGWGQRVLIEKLPPRTSGVAAALLLGEGAPMTNADWEKYVRTGVIHVLAISGQHLVILAGFLWFVLRRVGVRQRPGAVVVALCLLAYALLTGGRPSAMRAGVTVCVVAGAIVLRRRTLPANQFALAWLAVALLNPTDLFDAGCQFSFLAVAVLYWATRWLSDKEDDPIEEALDAARPLWLRAARQLGWMVLESYVVTVLIWVVIAPLSASRSHIIPTAGLLLGPPLTLLATIALFFGFALLALSPLPAAFTYLPAKVVHLCIALCEDLADWGESWSAHVYLADVPLWWLWLGYLAFLIALTQEPLRARWRWGAVAALAWLCVGLGAGAARFPKDELRCTFLAVGHGGCTVLETPDGRVLLYDAGAINGPEVTRRVIAPYLWSRGVRRIDEVFLSHADLDHFNGLADLLERFSVGQVTCTPTFQQRDNAPVRHTLAMLARQRVPICIVSAGDRLSAGPVAFEVLHPPSKGPAGPENARSLVLRVRHAGHSFLLTGDLEGQGMTQVLASPGERVDVLMAPHHGSHRVDGSGLTKWCRPRLVVSCQGPPRGAKKAPALYTKGGATFWTTHEHGAVRVRSHASGLVAETFSTKERRAVRREGARE